MYLLRCNKMDDKCCETLSWWNTNRRIQFVSGLETSPRLRQLSELLRHTFSLLHPCL
jgi:hypothetical protein